MHGYRRVLKVRKRDVLLYQIPQVAGIDQIARATYESKRTS
jgi:hypothetical protein